MPSKTQSILLGGLVVGLLGTSLLNLINMVCCLGVILGALVGVWHYTSTYNLTISPGQGVLIGTLAAVVGAVIAAVLNYLLALAGLDLTTELTLRAFERFGASPEQIEMVRQQAQSQGFGQMLFGLIVTCFVYGIVGAIGGAIGASVFKHGDGGSSPGGGGPRGGGPAGGPPPSDPAGRRPPASAPRDEVRPSARREEPAASYRPPPQEPRREEEPALQ